MVEPGDFGAFNYSGELEINARFENDDIDISEFLVNEGEDEIIDTIVLKELNRIKAMIGKKLDKQRTASIDKKFFKSLKKNFALGGKTFDDNVLKELSYIYFARYNNTMDIYYKIEANKQDLFYFMLDENLYNNINLTDDLDFEKFDSASKQLLQVAYENDVFNDVLDILKINPNFILKNKYYEYQKRQLKKENFENMINYLGKEYIAKCNDNEFKIVSHALEIGEIDYLSTLVNINPNNTFSSAIIFNDQVRKVFTAEEIAFFNSNQICILYRIIEVDPEQKIGDFHEKCLAYYNECLKLNPKFELENPSLIMSTIFSDLYIPPEMLSTLDKTNQNIICGLYTRYTFEKGFSGINSKIKASYYKNKINHFINKEMKKINISQPFNDIEITSDKPKQYLKK